MKKSVSFILSIIMILCLSFTGCAAQSGSAAEQRSTEIILQIGSPSMTVNGTIKAIDNEGTVPIILNDRTLLPVRAIIEEIGGTVSWDGDAYEVTLIYGNDEIKLKIDSPEAFLNGEKVILDTAPTIINDRTMLPVRFIAESFRFDVKWEEETQKVIITNSQNAKTQIDEIGTAPDLSGRKSIVIYFSCTGNTKKLAEKIAAATDSDMFEIVPEQPYTTQDIDYNSDCRANREQSDDSARPKIASIFENPDDYDTVYLGYPIWWGTMPKIINTFLETYDLSDKTVMPFCTSGSSGIGTSVKAIKQYLPDIKDGMRGTASTTAEQIKTWIDKNIQTEKTEMKLLIKIGDEILYAAMEDNTSAADLYELLKNGSIKIDMHDYSGFEKVGVLPQSLTRNDSQINTDYGDIILYQGNQFVIYYDKNSWSLTRLGHIENISQEKLKAVLGDGDVTVELSIQ
ncbi:MAG: hypothetical protein J6036_02120 [Clostridia bacterium]|nr:hypothetical protein [Clostridia bacterium]